MRIVLGKSKWEMWDDPLHTFLKRVKQSGFEASEIYLASLKESPLEITELHEQYNLKLIGQILTQGKDFHEHISSLERQFEFAVNCKPAIINTHSGRDIFSFEENCRIFARLIELGRESNIPVFVETHRGRPTYSAIETRKYLEEITSLRLTADFSHWMVVHESDLSDQVENIDLACSRSGYIHARIGYPEGPQVNDPRSPEWNHLLKRYSGLWQRIIKFCSERGEEKLFITPEFGPPDYMHTLPFTREAVADTREVNVYMRKFIMDNLF